MVIYDQWSYVTMFGTLEVVFTALGEGIQIDRLLFEESREEQASWQENGSLKMYLQMVAEDQVFILDIMVLVRKELDPACLRLVDIQFSDTCAQRAAVESEDFGSPVFATHFPIGLLKYPENVVALNCFQRFLGGR